MDVLELLYKISGEESRTPTDEAYLVVCQSLHHSNPDVRERAIFVGGLRWMDLTIAGYFIASLDYGIEEVEANRVLMIESLVSGAQEKEQLRTPVLRLIDRLLKGHPSSLETKVAYVGKQRLEGKMSKREFAVIDYDTVAVPADQIVNRD